MILNCNVLHQIEAEKIPSMEPNEPTDLRNIALNSKFGEKATRRNDLLPCKYIVYCCDILLSHILWAAALAYKLSEL